MKKFRVAKCLNNGTIKEMAIFEDGSRSLPIQKDNDGYEYISIDDWVNLDPDMEEFNSFQRHGVIADRRKLTFNSKPKDMIESIRRGFGDVIVQSKHVYAPIFEVRYYLDREYGNKLRLKTIEGWKNAEFAYGLYFNSKPIGIDGEYDWDKKNIYFSTVKQAIDIVDLLIKRSKDTAYKLDGEIFIEDKRYAVLDDYNSPCSDIVWYFLNDMHDYGERFTISNKYSEKIIRHRFSIKQEVVSNM